MAIDRLGFENMADGVRWNAPAAERNFEPILGVLRQVKPDPGTILEVAAGSGQHGAWLAPEFPDHCWAPSDIQPDALSSIDSWCHDAGGTILPARFLDASERIWPVDDIADDLVAIYNVNMIHISPWSSCLGMLTAAGKLLPRQGILFLYGPFLREGIPATESDHQFDQSLRSRNAAWGLRNVEDVVVAARCKGLSLLHKFDMPAGNLSLVFGPRA